MQSFGPSTKKTENNYKNTEILIQTLCVELSPQSKPTGAKVNYCWSILGI
jgi:hypothetical protein